MKELLAYREQLLARWAAVVDDLRRLLLACPAERLHRPLEAGGWTPHQIAAHLRDVEAQALWPRIERILQAEEPTLPNFDEQRWMQQRYDPDEPLAAILDEYGALRVREVTRLREAPPAAWNRGGRHPWFGRRTLLWWVERSLAHAEEHLAQLRAGLLAEVSDGS